MKIQLDYSNVIGAAVAAFLALGAGAGFAANTTGPNGESATPASAVTLTPDEEAKIRQGKHTAALAWHTSSDYTTAVDQGAKDEFARLGIEVVAATDAQFDPAKQKSDIETILAKKPSIILSLPVDPDTAAEVYRPALDAGVVLGFVDNAPKGFAQGKDYVTIVSDDLAQMGEKAADAMAAAIGGKGKVGYLFHDASFYVTNQRDQAFKNTIQSKYPGDPDRGRTGPCRSHRGRGHHQRLHDQESRSRRRLRDMGRACGIRPGGASQQRQRHDEAGHARPLRAARARHGEGRQRRGDRRRRGLRHRNHARPRGRRRPAEEGAAALPGSRCDRHHQGQSEGGLATIAAPRPAGFVCPRRNDVGEVVGDPER